MSIIERDAALSETAHTIAGLLRVAHLHYTHGHPAGESTRALQQRQAERLVRLQQPGALARAEGAAHQAVRALIDARIQALLTEETHSAVSVIRDVLLTLRDQLCVGGYVTNTAMTAFWSSLSQPNLCPCGRPWESTTDVLAGTCEPCRIAAHVSEVA